MITPDPDAGPSVPPLEYSLAFDGPEAWRSWAARHPGALSPQAIARALEAIRENGIVDHPFGAAIAADARPPLILDQGDVIHAGEPSSARALLTAFAELSSAGTEYARRRLKVLTKGLRPRHLGGLRAHQPFVVSADDGSPPSPGIGFDLVLADLSALPCAGSLGGLASLAGYLADHGRLIAALPFAPEPDSPGDPRCSWPVIDQLKQTGFDAVVIRWYASQSRGIVGQHGKGIFLVDARKSAPDDAARAESPQGLVGLIGLPRSGTTMLTALIEAHSRVHGVYEPWNARSKRYAPLLGKDDITVLGRHDPFDLSPHEFLNEFGVAMPPGKDWLLVKETTTMRPYIDAIEGLLAKPPHPSRRHLLWLVRDPFHVYLSELEARRKWWGAHDLAHSQETFERWAIRTLRSTSRLRDLARRFDGIIVSYEGLVRAPRDILSRLMARLQVPFEESQLEYHKTIRKPAVKGDNTVAKNPQEVSDASTASRQQEFEHLQSSIAHVALYDLIAEFSGWTGGLAERGIVDGADRYADRLDPILARVPARKKVAP